MNRTEPLTIEQRQLVNKRLTLNLLIQGAAAHAHWSAHHLIADQLNELNPELFAVYDEIMIRSRLGYWVGGIPMIMGCPIAFWLELEENRHEFSYHPFFVKYGHQLAIQTRDDVMERCRRANISTDAVANETRGFLLYHETVHLEELHLKPLEAIAKQVCCELYGIDSELLDAQLTQDPKFGTVREPETEAGKQILQVMLGWSAVVRGEDRLKVKARATFWSLLIHELVKGTVELLCLHGLNRIDDKDYKVVMDHTEHLEFEIPMLQIGGAVFRRLLEARPKEIPLADCIAGVSKMEPLVLESLMDHLIKSPNRSTDMIREFFAAS